MTTPANTAGALFLGEKRRDGWLAENVSWGPELASLDQTVFPMRGHLLPYADTVFNGRQVSTLLEEIPRLPPGVVIDEFARELLELGRPVLDGQHLYLWFLGVLRQRVRSTSEPNVS
ncbi:hypothetical protein ACFYWN_33065 [Streptomyces sp. NPDC002917]|uniref:hypothetical protein n=1 Tax=Streptomyces sp. NPDC002917 TaxID=3364671 RepID=UPI0036A26CEF